MSLPILQAGEAVLRGEARPLTPEEMTSPSTQDLIQSMRDTMRAASGVGLAAPQVGLPLQLAVIEDREEYIRNLTPEDVAERERRPVPFHSIANPRITCHSEELVEFFETCLSLPGYVALVPRWRAVRVEYLDGQACPQVIEASGWYARILQHEIDHLQGIEYVERMRPVSFMTVENHARFWKGRPIAAVRGALGRAEIGGEPEQRE